MKEPITFIVPVSNDTVYESSFLKSAFLKGKHHHEVITQRGYPSAALAYNDGMDKAKNDLVVMLHQDTYLPEGWTDDLERSLKYLKATDPGWGVLGCFGVTDDGTGKGCLYSNGLERVVGGGLAHPEPVQTLDEFILIMRRSSGLRFDPTLPNFHLYGTDICMAAASAGKRCYAIPAFCIHNSRRLFTLPKEFYICYFHIKKRWGSLLPIQTPCIRIDDRVLPVYKRRVKDLYIRYFKTPTSSKGYSPDAEKLCEDITKGLNIRLHGVE